MLTDTLPSTNSTAQYQSPYPTRYPKLGVSAVLRSKSISPLTSPQPKTLESPLRLDEPPSLSCRFRPGLRPVRIIDMSNFRFKRKQVDKNAAPNISDSQVRKSSSLLLQSRRQPLKAFQQNSLPSVSTTIYKPQDSPLSVQELPSTITRTQRISTNPKIRRYSSSEMAISRQCTDDSFAEHAFAEADNNQSRKRRSMPVRSGKKIKFRDSLESMDSNGTSVRDTSSSTSTPTSTLANDAAIYPSVKSGVMTRIRSQTQLAYEALKRVVHRHSKRRSGSYEVRRNAETY
ncbi:hypothetical protein Aperf_G00000126317 [Anoplocephala perfoliata]